MESQLNIYNKITLTLLLLSAGITLSSSIQETTRFITKSYLDKYSSFHNSKFQDFIKHLGGSCHEHPEVELKSSVIERRLIGEGSHRHLSSLIGFSIKSSSVSLTGNHSCKAIVVEKLPSGVFADPFELQHLRDRGAFRDVAVLGDTNLELPSFLSNRTVVEIHVNVGSNVLLRDKNEVKIEIDLPLHARYQPLDDSGYSNVKFEEPDLFMECSIEGQPNNQGCFFISSVESKAHVVAWRIPSGMKAHSGIVSAVTFIAAILSTLSIVWASLLCSSTDLSKSSKNL